jgi:hypothetical protein
MALKINVTILKSLNLYARYQQHNGDYTKLHVVATMAS